ncbi:hypothetical protein ASD15_24130 [Massilia sp. Root351]|uniref:hypothetical protein n=1 Tax=Massilia sp. Root351 TaxID=1736522 RepID=UPI00070FDCFE|nr:hypothetical protein [Massilia sp. Root351]KQV90386.1 hypothetical protein ASD15_24130 [Massilia sp. Root351]
MASSNDSNTGGKDQRDADPRNSQQAAAGNVANGHPANNVITPQRDGMPSTEPGRTTVDRGAGDFSSQRHGQSVQSEQSARTGAPQGGPTSGERGTRGSGMPVDSGAGQLADDRPGRDTPKGG